MRLKKYLVALACVIAVAGLVFAGHMSGDESLSKLFEGNKRFVDGNLTPKKCGPDRREELTKGQHPFAIVLSCSDSRVPPEIVFDQALGDIFVIRVAGNVVDPIALGSIEYGAEHLHSPLLVILGHTQCGAVTAALEVKGKPEGNIGAILNKIMPAVDTAKKAQKDKGETLNIAIKENIRNVHKDVMKSEIISHLVHEGKLKIVGGVYNLETGKVDLVELETVPAHAGHGH